MQTDIGALSATARVCDQQRHHLDRTRGYLDSSCAHLGAFGGVLHLLRGGYAAALDAASDGLDDSVRLARALREGVEAFRDDMVATEEEVEARMRRGAQAAQRVPAFSLVRGGPRGGGGARPPGDLLGAGPAAFPDLIGDVQGLQDQLLDVRDTLGGLDDLQDFADDPAEGAHDLLGDVRGAVRGWGR